MEVSSKSPLKVAIIDDDESAFFLTKDLLGDVGEHAYEVVWLANFESGLNQTSLIAPDVILIDYYIGARTGLELINALKEDGVTVPMILLTGSSDRDIDLEVMRAGASYFLLKDEVTGDILDRAIRYAIQHNQKKLHPTTLEEKLIHAQKLEAVGELAAGIAHEINSPLQYIGSNLDFLGKNFKKVEKLIEKFTEELSSTRSNTLSESDLRNLLEYFEELKLERGLVRVPKAIEHASYGVKQITHIIRSMMQIAHPGVDTPQEVDLNEIVQNALTISRFQWKHIAELETNFHADKLIISGFPVELNQVFLNLIVNAAHAVTDAKRHDKQHTGRISIQTLDMGDSAEIRLSDNGTGIAEELQDKIFQAFFTTKEIGKGTGQGLAVVHAIVVKKHKGTIELESEFGKGSTFVVRLPKERQTKVTKQD